MFTNEKKHLSGNKWILLANMYSWNALNAAHEGKKVLNSQESTNALGKQLISDTYVIGHYNPLYLLTYQLIGNYNPSVKIIDLISHTTDVVCDNLMHKWLHLQFKIDSELKIFWTHIFNVIKSV